MAIERIVQGQVTADDDNSAEEQEFEIKIRPHDFANYIGQERLKKNIQLAIQAAKKRDEALDHVLLYGPPGLGRTNNAPRAASHR
jgi:Holliday junction DNA helicase RuvB